MVQQLAQCKEVTVQATKFSVQSGLMRLHCSRKMLSQEQFLGLFFSCNLNILIAGEQTRITNEAVHIQEKRPLVSDIV